MYPPRAAPRMVAVRFMVPTIFLGIGMGVALAWGYVITYAFGGSFSLLFFFGAFVIVAAICGILFFWSSWPWIGMLPAMVVFMSAWLASSAFQNAELEANGRTGPCEIVDIVKYTYTETTGTGEHTTTTTRTGYRHVLRCPPGGPAQLSRGRPLADIGESLTVVWDRDGRVRPILASDRVASSVYWTFFLVAYGFALFLLWVEACIDLIRYPKRSVWDFGTDFMAIAERPSRLIHSLHPRRLSWIWDLVWIWGRPDRRERRYGRRPRSWHRRRSRRSSGG
jgi:hypothetical protein